MPPHHHIGASTLLSIVVLYVTQVSSDIYRDNNMIVWRPNTTLTDCIAGTQTLKNTFCGFSWWYCEMWSTHFNWHYMVRRQWVVSIQCVVPTNIVFLHFHEWVYDLTCIVHLNCEIVIIVMKPWVDIGIHPPQGTKLIYLGPQSNVPCDYCLKE